MVDHVFGEHQIRTTSSRAVPDSHIQIVKFFPDCLIPGLEQAGVVREPR